MAAVPYYTSNDLIAAVQRKIAFPISQNTFQPTDILAFANEEMMISQVPSVMLYHEEFFVTTQTVPLIVNQNRYPVPPRAIGMKLRALFWQDQNNNLFEMTRIHSEDRAFFQRNVGANQAVHKFYFEGNDIVLTPDLLFTPSGSLVFVYYLRPNQLVTNDRAAIVSGFAETIVVNNATVADGDTISVNYAFSVPGAGGSLVPNTIVFTARTTPSLPNDFQIGPDSITTATNFVNLVNSTNLTTSLTATNGSPGTSIITLMSPVNGFGAVTSNITNGFVISNLAVQFQNIPTIFTAGGLVDFLQTDSGHRTYAFDVQIPPGPATIQGTIINFAPGTIPPNLVVGDYICVANECIIPQIPSDLHNGLAERTCTRILAALGDQQGLGTAMQKMQEIEQRQGTLLDNRAEGDPQKLNARHSLLKFTKMGVRRRF